MAKVIIPVPEHFAFSTDIQVMIQHVNRADHLANEHLVALLNEARMRYVASLDFATSELDPRAFINADLAVVYKAEAHHGDMLTIEVTADDFGKYGCDFVYRVTRKSDERLIAIAKTAMLSFDYDNNCLAAVPDNFPSLFSA